MEANDMPYITNWELARLRPSMVIELSPGVTLSLTLRGNWMSAPKEVLKWLNNLAELVDKATKKNAP
jgi:hypothetical protein